MNIGKRTTIESVRTLTKIYETDDETKPVVEKEPTEQNPSETHEGGPEKDDPENKSKTEEA